jgi:hypothetical protein
VRTGAPSRLRFDDESTGDDLGTGTTGQVHRGAVHGNVSRADASRRSGTVSLPRRQRAPTRWRELVVFAPNTRRLYSCRRTAARSHASTQGAKCMHCARQGAGRGHLRLSGGVSLLPGVRSRGKLAGSAFGAQGSTSYRPMRRRRRANCRAPCRPTCRASSRPKLLYDRSVPCDEPCPHTRGWWRTVRMFFHGEMSMLYPVHTYISHA